MTAAESIRSNRNTESQAFTDFADELDLVGYQREMAWVGWKAATERAAKTAETLTAHRRTVYALLNSVPAKPCEIAAAIRGETNV